MQKIHGPRITITITQEQEDQLQKIMKRHKLKRNQAVRKMMDLGLETYSTYEMIGVPQLAEITKRAKKAVQNDAMPRLV